MKRLLALILALAMVIAFVSCDDDTPEPEEIAPPSPSAVESAPAEAEPEAEPEEEEAPVLFESDAIVNDFLIAYNALSGTPAVNIEKGNIRTKAICSNDGVYMVVIHAPEFLSVSIEGVVDEQLTDAFGAALRAVCAEFTDEEISAAIDEITNNRYEVDSNGTHPQTVYAVHGVQMQYIKSLYDDGKGRFSFISPLG